MRCRPFGFRYSYSKHKAGALKRRFGFIEVKYDEKGFFLFKLTLKLQYSYTTLCWRVVSTHTEPRVFGEIVHGVFIGNNLLLLPPPFHTPAYTVICFQNDCM